MKNNERSTIFVDFEHIASFYNEGSDSIEHLIIEYYRVEPFLKKAVHEFLLNIFPDFA